MLTEQCSNNKQTRHYNLVAVLWHAGSSPTSGHYTADVFHAASESWFHCDDGMVVPIDREHVLNPLQRTGVTPSTAYICVYQREKGQVKLIIFERVVQEACSGAPGQVCA